MKLRRLTRSPRRRAAERILRRRDLVPSPS
jgi:hypothetical protein